MVSSTEEAGGVAFLNRQIDTFYQVNKFISSIDDLGQLLELIMQEAAGAVEGEASCIALYDASDQRLNIEFSSGGKKEEVRHLSLALGQGILGVVAATNTALRVDDAQQDPRFEPSIDRATGYTTQSIVAAPIRRRDQLLGVLEVINKRGGPQFTDEDTALLEVVANQAAIAIDNARLLERMVLSERLSIIGRLSATVLHDFRTPMFTIRGAAEQLASPELEEDRRRNLSNLILEEVNRFAGMTQEVGDYSRGSIRLQPQEIQLGPWLERVAFFLQEHLAMSGVELITELEYRGPVHIDWERMRRVVINIASNAGDAMPDGGTLTLATRLQGEYWHMSLKDTGSGIAPQQRPKIFDPFYTFGKAHGTGLGLAIVRDIVERHGGTIQVESRVAGEEGGEVPGTTFVIRIPLIMQPGQETTAD